MKNLIWGILTLSIIFAATTALAVDDATVQAIEEKASSANSKADGNNSRIQALEAEDVQHARAAFKGDWTPKFIAVACVLFFGGYIALVTLQDPAANDDGIVNLVLGYLGGIVSSIISFYYGASHKHD